MIFAEKTRNSIWVLKLWKVKIKSRVYKYQDVVKFVLPHFDTTWFILKTSPFAIINGKEKDLYYIKEENWLEYNILFKDFFKKKQKNKNFQEIYNKTPINIYIKWRLWVLWITMKQYWIEVINLKELLKFIMYDITNIETAKHIANYLFYKEEYNIEDIRKMYNMCCSQKLDKTLYNFIKMIYKIDTTTENEKLNKFDLVKKKILNILSKEYDIPINILSNYHKTIAKITNYILNKQLNDNGLELIQKYKWSSDNIHLDIENLIISKKIKENKNWDIRQALSHIPSVSYNANELTEEEIDRIMNEN